MGGIEVAYELRNKTDYLIASLPRCLPLVSPMKKMMHSALGREEAMKQICREYYNHYNKYQVNSRVAFGGGRVGGKDRRIRAFGSEYALF